MALIPVDSGYSHLTRGWKYDVFLGHHKGLTSRNFADHLYAALQQKGVLTFRDDETLEIGHTTIMPELLKAIEQSRIAIVILSKNYASSTWCLDELAKIMGCQKKMGQTVFPVFNDIDPSVVRHQKGSFEMAFTVHEERFKENLEMVQIWRAALTEVANLSGWHLRDRRESLVIQEIIGVICGGESCSFPLSSSVLLVGIDSRVDEIISSLEIGLTDVRMIGICGMGGIGKTTIARVAYERLANQFEGSSFLADVGVGANKESGLICLQERLLYDILIERDTRISNVHEGVDLIRTRLCTKKILLVLDDVNRFEQLEALARNGFFGRGSRIIITSRDRHLLSAFGVDKINEPKLLNCEEALGLFSFKSFRNKDPPKEYSEMSKYFVYYAHGVPLVINVWGSFLFRRTIQEWKGALDKVKLNPTLEIWDLLKISFDGLDKMEREIFLDIACFFKGEDKDRVIKILDVLGYADVGLMILIEKSLLTISSDNRLWMHDVVQEMAREIVRQECVEEPAKRSRLWKQEDIDDVLSKNKGTVAIEEIVLNLSVQNEVRWNPEAFSKMHNLRFLKIGNVQLPRGLTHFPNALKLVEWSEYPLKSLPTNFHPRELVELNMCRGNFELLWQGVKYLDKLKFITLRHSQNLLRTPDFIGVPNLQRLDIEGCTNLIEVHPSIGDLKRLIFLNLKDCTCLRSLPSRIIAESLEILILSGCSNVEKIPDFGENMQQLRELYLNGTAIKKLPSSVEQLTGLTLLDLSHCKDLVYLPCTIVRLENLREFIVFGCSKLAKFEYHGTVEPIHVPEIELISSKKQEFSLDHEAIGLEISNKWLSIISEETETACSQTEGEGQTKSELTMHVGEPIEPPTPLAVSTSGTSEGAAEEPSLSGSSKLVEVPGPDVTPIFLEKQEWLSAYGTKIMEKEGRMPILETEIKTVPSQPKEGRVESKLNVGESIEPLTLIAVSTPGTSRQVAVEPVPVTMLPSGINEIEIAPTDGQLLLEVSTCPKKSIDRTLLRILRYMSDVTARRIGVHGSGGSGKTSVLKALINQPLIKDLFDVVIWVTVSRNWSTRKIQDEVLRQLSLSSSQDFETNFEAAQLFQALKSRRFLLLLDDVWERIDLDAVGIPNPTLENGCRMILATRSPYVCHIMVADKEVQVERLLPEEAWELFQEQVGGIIEDSPNIQPYAQDIVQKCGGLPLLIIVTGRALTKENDALCWMHASREFPWCSAHEMYGFESLLQQLKFSYDRLEGPYLKSCFLYCALFPEDWEVSIFELVGCWIKEGLISGNCTDTYKRGYDIVGVLIGASLLQSSECGLFIKMHDLIRDLASRILSLEVEGCRFLLGTYSRMTQQLDTGNSSSYRLLESFQSNKQSFLHGHQLLLRAGAGLTEPPSKDEWEEAQMIFLMDNELSSLPERSSCPKLLALFLQRNHHLREIPLSFFDLMPSLTVLNLSKTRIKSLPKSLFRLMSLEVLILCNCERLAQLPSEVGSLRRLEVLDLQGTEIDKLPEEIYDLASLRHLKVSFYGSVNPSEFIRLPHELVPRGIISNLLELETLSIDVYPGDKRWDKNVDSVINEVGNLTKLINFCCCFPEVQFLERFLEKSLSWKIRHLTDFKFVVGHDVKRFVYRVVDNLEFEYLHWGQCLRFVNGEMIPDAVLIVLTCSTAFYLDHHIEVCSLSDFGISNLNGLRLCVVRDCPKIEAVIASNELSEAVFPILEHLSIYYLSNLGRLWEGMIPQGSFNMLRILTVHTCLKLKFVFATSMLQFFSNLEELIVEHCPAITEIIFQDRVVDSGSGTLPRLKTIKLHYLPELVDIMQGAWPPLENISFYNCPILKKLGIDSKTSHTIKEIKAENGWWEELDWQDTSLRLRLNSCFTPISDYDL